MLCWLKIRIDNLSQFAFSLVIVVLEKHFSSRNQFFYLQKNKKMRGPKLREKNSSPFFKKILSTLVLFLSCFRSSNFFLIDLFLWYCFYWDLRFIICFDYLDLKKSLVIGLRLGFTINPILVVEKNIKWGDQNWNREIMEGL